MPKKLDTPTHEVPKQIFEQYLAKLAAENFPVDAIERLRSALIEEGNFSEASLRSALFGPDQKT